MFHFNIIKIDIVLKYKSRNRRWKNVALVGHGGSGKSTAKSIPRFYKIDSGSIIIDNQNIEGVRTSSLRDFTC